MELFGLNILDLAVLILFAYFLLAGWYAGFVNTLFSLGAYTLSCGLSLLLHPLLANWVKSNAGLYNAALYYAEGAELVKDVEFARANISSLGSAQLAGIMESAKLPIPMEARITQNIAREAFAKADIFTLGEYFNQTIINVVINIACVLILFVLIRLVFSFVIHLLDYARKGYPTLQTADGLLGACFGLIRGFLAMFIVFMIVPVVLIILPTLGSFFADSFFGNFFYNSNFLLRLIPGT